MRLPIELGAVDAVRSAGPLRLQQRLVCSRIALRSAPLAGWRLQLIGTRDRDPIQPWLEPRMRTVSQAFAVREEALPLAARDDGQRQQPWVLRRNRFAAE
jgi:hypothetical protein